MLADARENRWWMLCVSTVMFDSMVQYFLVNFVGVALPVNALLPVLLVVALYRFGVAAIIPGLNSLIPIAVLLFGCLVGVVVVPELGYRKLFEIGTALSALIIGYNAFRTVSSDDTLANWFLAIGFIYSAVCSVAIMKLLPSLLPVYYVVGLREGELVTRAEITIDQNFQIYYLFVCAFALAAPIRFWRTSLALLACVGAYFTVAKLQTRSGTILLSLAIAMSLLISMRSNSGGKVKLLFIPLIVLIVGYFGVDLIKSQGSELISRFQEKEYETFYSRLFAASFFIEKLMDPSYWIPQGNAAYMAKYGGLPHFTPAGFLLEGGILAVIGSLFVFYLPLLRLVVRNLKFRLDLVANIALVGGVVSLAASLSLNALLFEHMWLWGGAVLGVLVRQISGSQANVRDVPAAAQVSKPKLLQV